MNWRKNYKKTKQNKIRWNMYNVNLIFIDKQTRNDKQKKKNHNLSELLVTTKHARKKERKNQRTIILFFVKIYWIKWFFCFYLQEEYEKQMKIYSKIFMNKQI